MRIATFNVQNLRLRKRGGRPVLDAASDRDVPFDRFPVERAIADRRETAKLIANAAADVVALQEVFDLASLDYFASTFLGPAGAPSYPHRFCHPGNDGSGNVAALSRRRPIAARSHAALTGEALGLHDLPPDLRTQPILRRDCFELEYARITLFICHFKAPYPDSARARIIRNAEARAVRKIIEQRFAQPADAHWAILGDFNVPVRLHSSEPISIDVLKDGFAVDLLDRLPPEQGWTYSVAETGLKTCPDRILVSPRLADAFPGVLPRILRSGAGSAQPASKLDREMSVVGNASDHALVMVDLDGL